MTGDYAYTMDLSKIKMPSLQSNLIHMGTAKNPKGDILTANNKYLLKNGKPWLPVMGEFHYTRYTREGWENAILKMKAGGIEVIATYIFWIHHEEEKGKWNWHENCDLRYFVSLCAKHQLYVFPRLGPWCHGEARNGGHPDWLTKGTGLKRWTLRQKNPIYMGFTKELYRQIHDQLKGFYFKEGGPIIGVQVENERTFNNPGGLEYMLGLKQLAREVGIDVPFYTATGWQGYDYNQRELIPMWGAYPDAPWDGSLQELVDNKRGFHFTPYIHESDIGNDLLPTQCKMGTVDDFPFPFLTVEMGAGTQCTHHRRPTFNMYDGAALITTKIGSGANGIGYYVFHGGSNPIGKLTPMQESKASHYPNDLPIISYDFYAPLGEWDQVRPSYKKLKLMHFFLQEWGQFLATYPTLFPQMRPTDIKDHQTLRWTVRSNGESGFLFINNYQRHLMMDDISNVQFKLQLHNGTRMIFPETPIIIPNNTIGVFPFNLAIDNLNLIHATAQPFCLLKSTDDAPNTLVMGAFPGIQAELMLSTQNIKLISGKGCEITKGEKGWKILVPNPGLQVEIKVEGTNGAISNILVMDQANMLNAWKIALHGRDYLLFSDAIIFSKEDSLTLQSPGNAHVDLYSYPRGAGFNPSGNVVMVPGKAPEGIFEKVTLQFPEKKIPLQWQEAPSLAINLKKSAAPKHPSLLSPIRCYPLYDTVLARVEGARYWKVKIPMDLFQGVSKVFLTIDYEGDSLAAYMNGKLIADNFFAGEPMSIGLNRFKAEVNGNEMILLVTPMISLDKVYLEKQVKEKFATTGLGAKIKAIDAIPQYETQLTLK